MLLEKQEDMKVVAEAANAEEAFSAFKNHEIDLVLMDIGLPDMDGLEATKRIKELQPDAIILVLTMHDDEPYLLKALKENVSGYLLKEAASTELVNAIRSAMEGETVLHPSLIKILVEGTLEKREIKNSGEKELTGREKEVLRYISLGYTNQEIADKLIVSVKTIEKHKYHIMEKLDLKRRHELVQYAIKEGLINLADDS